MPRTIITLTLFGFALGLVLTGCSPCGSLEEKICEDLGEAQCETWRDHDMPGFPGGRRQFRQCVNSQWGTRYDVTLQAVQASVKALESVPQQ